MIESVAGQLRQVCWTNILDVCRLDSGFVKFHGSKLNDTTVCCWQLALSHTVCKFSGILFSSKFCESDFNFFLLLLLLRSLSL